MKFIKQEQTKEFRNSAICIVEEYPHGDVDINGSVIEIKGRYPEKGRVVNLKCKELVYVLVGEGSIAVEQETFHFSGGDMFIIDAKERYYWQAECKILTVCTPAFESGQHKIVD